MKIKAPARINLVAIGERLRAIRGDRTLLEIEAKSGVGKNSIERAEKGVSAPKLPLLDFSRSEGIPLEFIIYGSSAEGFPQEQVKIWAKGLPPQERTELARDLLS